MQFRAPREYVDLVRQLEELVASGAFRLLHGTSALAELQENRRWPDDVITHVFECCNCGQRFRLSADTYHGSGGSWEMEIAAGSREIQ